MYDMTFPAQSIKSGIWEELEIVNDETDALFDLSALTAVNFAIREKGATTSLVTGSLTDGRIELPSTGVLRLVVPASAFTSFNAAGTYEISITGTDGSVVSQLVLGEIPFLNGF